MDNKFGDTKIALGGQGFYNCLCYQPQNLDNNFTLQMLDHWVNMSIDMALID